MAKQDDGAGSQTGDPLVAEINSRYDVLSKEACAAYSKKLLSRKPMKYSELQQKLRQLDEARANEIAALTPKPAAKQNPEPLAAIKCGPGAGFMQEPKAKRVPGKVVPLAAAKDQDVPAKSPAPGATTAVAVDKATSNAKPAVPTAQSPAAAPTTSGRKPPMPKVVIMPVSGFSLQAVRADLAKVGTGMLKEYREGAAQIVVKLPTPAPDLTIGRAGMIEAAMRLFNQRVLQLNTLQIAASEKLSAWRGTAIAPLDEAKRRLLDTAGIRASSGQLDQIQICARAVQSAITAVEQRIEGIRLSFVAQFRSALQADLRAIDRIAPVGVEAAAGTDDGSNNEDAA